MAKKVTFAVVELNKPSEEAICRLNEIVYKWILAMDIKESQSSYENGGESEN